MLPVWEKGAAAPEEASQRNTARLSHFDSQEASTRLGETLRLHYEGSNHYNSIVSKQGYRRSDSSPTPEPGTLEDTALANARARRRHYESLSEDNHEGKTEEGGQKESGPKSRTGSSSDMQVEDERLLMLMRGGVKFLPVQIDDDILFIIIQFQVIPELWKMKKENYSLR